MIPPLTAAESAELEAAQAKVLSLRGDFPILNRPLAFGGKPRTLVYLDNAATTQKPRAVLDAMTGYYENANANVHRAIHSLGEEATRIFEQAREDVRRFIGAPKVENIVFTRGATESFNLLASSFGQLMQAGDVVITTEMEHHANLVPWQILAERRGVVVKYLPIDDRGVLLIDKLAELWSDRVKLVTLTAMSNVLGTINPIAEVVKFAHARGVPVCVDAAQSVPHGVTNVQATDVDFLMFSSHKMAGPTGFGVLYAKTKWLEAMPPYHGGGEMIRSVTLEGYETNVLPYKFEAGTPHMEGAAGLSAAIAYLERVGLDWIHRYEDLLTRYTWQKLAAIPGVTIYGTAPDKGGILAFSLAGVHAHDLSAFLDARGIAVRAGHHCAHPLARRLGVVSTARASFWFYNTVVEADAFIAAMHDAARTL